MLGYGLIRGSKFGLGAHRSPLRRPARRGLAQVTPAVDNVVARLYTDIVGAYWPPERALVESGYRDLPFPFEPIQAAPLSLRADWPLDRLIGYLGSWSAVQRCKDATGSDPVASVRDALAAAWGGAASRAVVWPLALRVGRAAR